MNCLRLNYPYINLSAGFIGKAKFDHTLSLRHFVTLLRGNGDEIFGDEQNEKSSSSSNPDKEVQEQLSEDIINLITENDEPSKDIDLGSVQEV